MSRRFLPWALLCVAALTAPALNAYAQSTEPNREDARLITATQVLEELRATPDQNSRTG